MKATHLMKHEVSQPGKEQENIKLTRPLHQ